MKKIIKGKRALENSFFFILGAILFGSAGVLASSYILKSSDIEYKANKSVQEAVEELYTLVDNDGSAEALFKLTANGAPTANQNQIIVNFNKVEPSTPTITCKATSSSGTVVTGVVSDNTCTFSGLIPSTEYTYEVVRTDQNGTTNSITGSKTTPSSGAMLVTDNKPTGTIGVAYLDPTDLSKTCNAQNSRSGTGTKSGCMKWYVYKEDSSSYTMILDHNTTGTGNGWSVAETQLATDVVGWTGAPRLITGQEIADITGNTSWTSTGSYFYFDTNTTTSTNEGKYYWLYDYTNCGGYGCKVSDRLTYGYWTSISKGSSYAWSVEYNGQLDSRDVNSSLIGVRPVITISKSNL